MMRYICFIVVVIIYLTEPAVAFECIGSTYNGLSFDQQISTFSPYDKIYVMISCRDLDVNDYTIHVNWVNNRQGLIRSESQQLQVTEKGDQRAYFWFKLSRKGPLKSTFTNEDFNEKLFGEWVVEGFVNDEPVSINEFVISY